MISMPGLFLTPEIIGDLLSAAGVAALLWWRIGRVEKQVREQNGRIDKLELWKAEREGFQKGGKRRHEREQGDHG